MTGVGYSKVRHKDHELPAENATSCYLLRMRAAVPLLVCLLVSPGSLYATSVVALSDRANNRLVIAADCRVDRDSGSTSGCKIINEPTASLLSPDSMQKNLRASTCEGWFTELAVTLATCEVRPRYSWRPLAPLTKRRSVESARFSARLCQDDREPTNGSDLRRSSRRPSSTRGPRLHRGFGGTSDRRAIR